MAAHASNLLIEHSPGENELFRLALEQSGLEPFLREDRIEFVDLNHDDVFATANRSGLTHLPQLFLPQTLRRADFIVSLPKLKTHHWAGVTLSMKNLFGVMPGICYGWPKNVLHFAGIDRAIVDINAAVRPDLAIVDGVVGMEGDGPIMGKPRQLGFVAMGSDLPAVDSTCARVIGLDPAKITYLEAAGHFLGNTGERRIDQRGEPIARYATQFDVVPSLQHLRLAQ